MTSLKNVWIAMIVVAIIAVIGIFSSLGKSATFGGVTNYDEVDATAIKIGGTNGSRVGPIISTTCTLLANTSITASTTANVDCVVAGVNPGDIVTGNLQASTTNASNYDIRGISASSTAGFITFSLYNQTGANAVPAATNGFGSSTEVMVMHPVATVPGL